MRAVVYTTDWCGPCNIMKNMYLYELRVNGFDIDIVNIEEHPETKEEFNIVSVPTTFFYDGDTVKEKVIGFMPREKFVGHLEDGKDT